MKTIVTPFVLSSDESSRLLSCTENETSIILGDDAYHNLRISLQHAKLLLESGVYSRIYYINLPFSGKRFRENYKAAEIPEDKRLVMFNVCSGYLAETMRDIRQIISNLGDEGRAAVIINSWEMSSRSYRHRDDLVFTIYSMQMLAECTFYVYSVAEAKHIIMRRSSRAGFGKLVMIADELVDLSTGKYTVAKKEKQEKEKEDKQAEIEKLLVEVDEKKYSYSEADKLEGDQKREYLEKYYEENYRIARQKDHNIAVRRGKKNTPFSYDEDDDMSASLVEDNPITVGPDGVCANVDDRKINELDIEVGQEEGYRQAA
ncbi:MAG TPA: hypothetical protein VIX80_10225 [Candidatus Kapabacteria bacterium]